MIAVDANILLELLENRRNVVKVQSAIKQYVETGEDFAVSALSVSHVFYLAEAHKVPMEMVEQLVLKYKIFDVTATDVDWALARYKGVDFEDAVQVAAAIREKCQVFLTLDTALTKKFGKVLNIELIG